METTFYNIKVPFEAAGIRSEFHTHWQAEDDSEHVGRKCVGGVVVGAGVATGTCIAASFLFPPLAAACPLIIPGAIGAGAGCAGYMLATMGDLGESMVTQLKRGADPIILVGHSWGGDTAYEFARKHLPRAIKESKHKPKVILVTLDAVGEKGRYRLGKGDHWINVHNGKEAQSGCGGKIVNLADLLGSNPYGIQRNADVDIRIDDRVRRSLIPGQYISNVTLTVILTSCTTLSRNILPMRSRMFVVATFRYRWRISRTGCVMANGAGGLIFQWVSPIEA